MNLREMEPREKKMLVLGAVALVVFIVIWKVTGDEPGNRGDDLKRVEHNRDLFIADLKEYQRLRGTVEKVDKSLEKTPPDFDLYGALNEMVEDLDLRSAIKKMTPHDASGTEFYSESYVDMDIKEVSLDGLVELLKKIEDSPAFLRVSQLSVKRRFKEEGLLDVSIRVAAYAPPKPETEEP